MAIQLPAEAQPSPDAPKRITMKQFFALTEGKFAEWVDGEIIYMTVSDTHQNLVDFLTALMRHFAEAYDLGLVRSASYPIRLRQRPSIREPDVMFVSSANEHRMKRNYLDGPADIAVEVVSPESRTRDRRDKRFEYAQAGVREYWIIDHEKERAEFFLLGEDGAYDPIPLDAEGIFHSIVLPGFWLRVSWLWQRPLPKLMTVLQQWGLVAT